MDSSYQRRVYESPVLRELARFGNEPSPDSFKLHMWPAVVRECLMAGLHNNMSDAEIVKLTVTQLTVANEFLQGELERKRLMEPILIKLEDGRMFTDEQ